MLQNGSAGFDYRPQNGHGHSRITHGPNMGSVDTRKGDYVPQQVSSRKFKGDLSRSEDLLLRDYDACAHQHRLAPAQKAEYFMNVLEGPAHTYLLNNYSQEMAYGQVVELMKREYDSDSRQLQVQSTLECLNVDAFMSVRSLTAH